MTLAYRRGKSDSEVQEVSGKRGGIKGIRGDTLTKEKPTKQRKGKLLVRYEPSVFSQGLGPKKKREKKKRKKSRGVTEEKRSGRRGARDGKITRERLRAGDGGSFKAKKGDLRKE